MIEGSAGQAELSKIFNAALDSHVPAGAPLCVAYSGGVDSTVLLWLAANTQSRPVRAVHINHRLQADADDWAQHCVAASSELGVACQVLSVQVNSAGCGLEAAARDVRYAALAEQLKSSEVLLTAHHEQDQLETVLLQLMRGAGIKGLAAMPSYTTDKGFAHARPLLQATSTSIRCLAAEQQLSWHEDPSNTDTDLDRNFLRHRVLPVLNERWPAAARTVGRAARLSGEAAELLDELAQADVGSLTALPCMDVSRLAQLSPARRRNALRYALRHWGLAVPSELQLRAALDGLLSVRSDSQPLAAWAGVRVRRYRDQLWFFSELDDPGEGPSLTAASYDWQTGQSLDMGRVRGTLELAAVTGKGIAGSWLQQPLVVRFRQGGEQLRPKLGGRTRQLKKLLQETDVVPWMRGNIPLIYAGDTLLAVGDIWIDADCQAAPNESGYEPIWTNHAPLNKVSPLLGSRLSGNL